MKLLEELPEGIITVNKTKRTIEFINMKFRKMFLSEDKQIVKFYPIAQDA